MRLCSSVARVVAVVLAVALMSWQASGYLGCWEQYWRCVAHSDIVAVGVLSNVSSSSVDGYLRFQGDLEIESVVVGNVASGDTLRMHWERADPRGPFGTKTIKSATLDPEHEQYAAIGQEFPGVRVLWFLNLREEGGVTAESKSSLISLSSDTTLKYVIEDLVESPGPPEIDADVRNLLELLREEYARHPAVANRASQRSN